MSRYLQDLVMRSLGEVGGLIPRALNRYETVRQGGSPEPTEGIPATEAMNLPLENGRSFQDVSSRTFPPMTEAGLTEAVVQTGGQTNVHRPSNPGEESIETRRQIQRGISGERMDEVDVPMDEHVFAPRRSMDKTQVSRHSSVIQPVRRQVQTQEVDGVAAHALQANVASPERRDLLATGRAEQLESLSGMRAGAGHPVDQENLRPSVRGQEISSVPLRPTLEEASFRRAYREETAPSAGERPPVVQIRIGRIEVRAIEQPVHAPSRKVAEPPRSSLPLDQYLRRRSRET